MEAFRLRPAERDYDATHRQMPAAGGQAGKAVVRGDDPRSHERGYGEYGWGGEWMTVLSSGRVGSGHLDIVCYG